MVGLCNIQIYKIYQKWIYTEILKYAILFNPNTVSITSVMNDVSTFYLDGGFCPTHAKK